MMFEHNLKLFNKPLSNLLVENTFWGTNNVESEENGFHHNVRTRALLREKSSSIRDSRS